MCNRDGFVKVMKECGYPELSGLTPQRQQLVNVAWQCWKERQKEIDEIAEKVHNFKSALAEL